MFYPWQHTQWHYIQGLIHQDSLPHALLFAGLPNIGKHAFAHYVAKSLLCLEPNQQQACGTCKSCHLFASNSHPDFTIIRRIEGKKDISIEQVRELANFLHLSQSISQNRVIVIEKAESMNLNAANSLLKNLEEPTNNTIILLITSQANQLLATIRSRCQLLSFPLPDAKLAQQWLAQQALTHQAEMLLNVAAGQPLLAVNYDNEERLAARVRLVNDIGRLLTGQRSWVEIAKDWQSHSLSELLTWQLMWVQDLIVLQHGEGFLRSTDIKGQLLRINEIIDKKNLFLLYNELINRVKISTHSINKLLFFEDTLLCWQRVKK